MVRYWQYLLFFSLLPFLALSWWHTPLDAHFFFGSAEKHHGYIWYTLLIVLTLLISTLTFEEKKRLVYASMIWSIWVAVFAISEYFLWHSVFGNFSWWSGRSASTLWNPNYVAGYLLICLPLASLLRLPERWVYFSCLIFWILATGSYIWACCMLLFILFLFLRLPFSSIKAGGITLAVSIIAGYLVFQCLSPGKLLSLESRFILMQDLWTHMVQYPFSFLFWFGPESIISYFQDGRSEIINAYFPSTSAIDSSHNILLDFFFQYGILPLLTLGYLSLRYWKILRSQAQQGIILGVLFLSLNVTITAHMILFILLGSFYKDKTDSTVK